MSGDSDRVGLLELQLKAMKSVFAIQEKIFAENGFSAALHAKAQALQHHQSTPHAVLENQFDDQSTALSTLKQSRGMHSERIVSKTFKTVKLDSFPYLKLLELWRKKCVTLTVARLQAEKVRTSSHRGRIIHLMSSSDFDCFSLLLCFCYSLVSSCQFRLSAYSSCHSNICFAAPLLLLVLHIFCFYITISYRACVYVRTYVQDLQGALRGLKESRSRDRLLCAQHSAVAIGWTVSHPLLPLCMKRSCLRITLDTSSSFPFFPSPFNCILYKLASFHFYFVFVFNYRTDCRF